MQILLGLGQIQIIDSIDYSTQPTLKIGTPPPPLHTHKHKYSTKEIDSASNLDIKPLVKSHKIQKHNNYSSNKNHQTNTLIYLTDTYPKTEDTNPIEEENRNITESQRQALNKGIQMAKTIKSKLDWKQNSNATWILTTIKRLIIKLFKKPGNPFFSFKRTKESA